MKLVKEVSYEEVLDFFLKEHPISDESPHFSGNKWGKLHLEQADKIAEGRWGLYELSCEDVFAIVVPLHEAEQGESVLVEENGLIVKDAIEKLQQNLPAYAEHNPVCWAKIMYWQNKAFSPLFLSTFPAHQGRRSHVNPALGNIFHLDGLHRLMRWGMDGRFDPGSEEKLTAYIAGTV